MKTKQIKNKKTYHIHAALMSALLISCLCLSACGSKETKSVEDEVTERIIESIGSADTGSDNTGDNTDTPDTGSGSGISTVTDNDETSPVMPGPGRTGTDSAKAGSVGQSSPKQNGQKEKPENINPFMGDTSTATSYNIKFEIETDSGLAGITFGSDDGTNGEYYLFAFDCTREYPYLHTSRRIDDAVYDEESTPLDFMYPEMSMFTGGAHIIEIKVNGTTATTYLDSYKVCDTTLNSAKPCGQIGTWVQKGNYHEYIDNLFVAEGVEGDGEWIYSDDFARASNLFYPDLNTRDGRLYARSGFYTAPSKKNN